MRKVLLVLLFGMTLFSCTTYHFVPMPGNDISIKSERGNSYPIINKNSVKMIVIPEYSDTELMLKILVRNDTQNTVLFKDTDYEVSTSDDQLVWENLKVYTSNEYYKKEKSEYTAGAALMVLSAVASSYNAGRGYSTTRGNLYGNSRYGSYSGSYSSSTTYYDPTAAELANQRNAQAVATYAQNGEKWLEILENNLFYTAEIEPNTEYFGLVFSKGGDGKYYRIRCLNPSIDIISIEYERIED